MINNAGIVVAGPLEALPPEKFRHQFEVNVIGQVAVTQAFLPLIRQTQGRILNMSSISGRAALPLLSPYASSKFALEALTDALRLEVCDEGIKVILIEPGSIDTPIWNKVESDVEELQAEIPQPLREHYQPLMTRMKELTSESAAHSLPVDRVVDVVVHALTVKNPKARYVVGASARTLAILKRLLPDRLFDAMIRRKLQRG